MFHRILAPFTFDLIRGGCGSPRKVTGKHVSSVSEPRRCAVILKLCPQIFGTARDGNRSLEPGSAW